MKKMFAATVLFIGFALTASTVMAGKTGLGTSSPQKEKETIYAPVAPTAFVITKAEVSDFAVILETTERSTATVEKSFMSKETITDKTSAARGKPDRSRRLIYSSTDKETTYRSLRQNIRRNDPGRNSHRWKDIHRRLCS